MLDSKLIDNRVLFIKFKHHYIFTLIYKYFILAKIIKIINDDFIFKLKFIFYFVIINPHLDIEVETGGDSLF